MVKTGACVTNLEEVIEELKADKIAVNKAQTIINAIDKELKAFSLYLSACKLNGVKPDMKYFDLTK
jgi:hypothetical protein